MVSLDAHEVKRISKKPLVILGVLMLLLLFGSCSAGCTYRAIFLRFVDNYEIPYMYDRRDGSIKMLDRTGYIQKLPFVQNVHTIDGRPMQVCISAIQRVLNCKLVQFNPEGLELFLEWHGRSNYSNPGVFNEILKAYAYEGSGKNYPFLTVIRELKPGEIDAPPETRR